jgi:hypothetical protein
VDYFLGGVFTTYGSDVLTMSNEDPEDRTDPLNTVFPKVSELTSDGRKNSVPYILYICTSI